jgi:lipopolysaccharide export system permease protein
MQIINRALARELTTSTLAVAFIFVALFMVVSLVKILAKAAAGSFPVTLVFTMLGLQTVEVLGLMLPLAFYVGLILALGRWYRDNEMTVLNACGVSLVQLLRPVLTMALAFALLSTLLAFYLAPLASRQVAMIKQDQTSRHEVAAITPGVFNGVALGEQGRDTGAYYVENLARDGVMQHVFMAVSQHGRQGVLFARQGREVTEPASDERFLELTQGVRYEGTPGQADYQIIEFERYRIRIELPAPRLRHTPFHAIPTLELWKQRSSGAIAEWHWRISKPMALLVLMLFGLVFSYTHPRRGRFAGLFVAIIAYFLYSNLLGVGDAMLKRGRVPGMVGLWWVHALFLGLGAYLFWQRVRNRPLVPAIPIPRRRRGAA